eukprot:jgi/Mesen1/10443/ME000082S09947
MCVLVPADHSMCSRLAIPALSKQHRKPYRTFHFARSLTRPIFVATEATDPSSPSDLFCTRKPVRTLEISTAPQGPWSLLPGGQEQGVALLQSGAIHATVHPDLPPVTTLRELFVPRQKRSSKEKRRDEGPTQGQQWPLAGAGGVVPSGADSSASGSSLGQGVGTRAWQVRTVAAQTRSLPVLCKRMIEKADQIAATHAGGSLLLVSGGHPLRALPLARHVMPSNSVAMLRAAHQLRAQGLLHPSVQLWAVENPLQHTPDRLARKIEAGAECIITQPPLLPDRFQAWWESAAQQGLLKETRVIVGLPIISSSNNLAFWMRLTNASGPEADMRLAEFKQQEEILADVDGVHFMPVNRVGWEDFASFCHDLVS